MGKMAKVRRACTSAALMLAASVVCAPCALAQTTRLSATAAFPPSVELEALESWLPANTTVPLGAVVSVGGGRVIAITNRMQAPGGDQMRTIVIRTEIIDRAEAEKVQALSESQDLTVDCVNRQAKAGAMRLFTGRGLSGFSRKTPGWTSWSSAPPATTLGRMIAAACNPNFLGSFAFKSPTAPPPAAKTAPAETQLAQAPPAPSVLEQSSPPVAAAAPATNSKPQPTPSPVPAAKASDQPPAATQARPDPSRTVTQAGRAGPRLRSTAAAAGGRSLVQVGASRSRAQAEMLLANFQKTHKALAAGRPASFEETVVGEQTFFRVLIGGFAATAEASAFCRELQAAGGVCLLRQR